MSATTFEKHASLSSLMMRRSRERPMANWMIWAEEYIKRIDPFTPLRTQLEKFRKQTGKSVAAPPEYPISLGNNDNSLRIFPFLTGEDINGHPQSWPERFVIDFGTMSLDEVRRWPDVLNIVEERVKPERDNHSHNSIAVRQRNIWWRFRSDTPNLKAAISTLPRCLAASRISNNIGFSFQPISERACAVDRCSTRTGEHNLRLFSGKLPVMSS